MGIKESDSEGKDPKDMSLSELVETLALAATRFGYQTTHVEQTYNILKQIKKNYETTIKPYKEELDKREQEYKSKCRNLFADYEVRDVNLKKKSRGKKK